MGAFDWTVIIKNMPFFMSGLLTTFELAVVAISGGLFFGMLVGMARLSDIKLIYYPATIFVNFFRSLPLLLVIFWFYFLVPIIAGRPLGDFVSASVAFVVFEAAYFAEIVRAGIQSISKGQVQAAYAEATAPLDVVSRPEPWRRPEHVQGNSSRFLWHRCQIFDFPVSSGIPGRWVNSS